MNISNRTAAALTLPKAKSDAIFFDAALPGFGLRLRRAADGKVRKSYVVQYRRACRTRRVLVGAANLLPAEQAKKRAKEILAQVALGTDPQGDRIARRSKDARTLSAVTEEYLAAHAQRRPRTLVEMRRYLSGSYFKPLHSTPVDTISRADVATRLTVIMREHGSTVAAHARAKLNALCSWAVAMGIADANPVIGTVQPEAGRSRERVLSDAELAAIWRGCGDDAYGRIIRLLLLTGCRRQEVGSMEWDELDLPHGTWTIPGTRTKNHKTHMLALPPLALSIIEATPRMAQRANLFGVRGGGFSRWSQGKAELDADSGVKDWTLHDLRRTMATRLADLGAQPHVIEQLLNHQSGHRAGPAGIYNRSTYEQEARAALALWADHISALIERRKHKLVSMRRSA